MFCDIRFDVRIDVIRPTIYHSHPLGPDKNDVIFASENVLYILLSFLVFTNSDERSTVRLGTARGNLGLEESR